MGRGDGIVTAEPDVYLSMRFGDCVPILLNDPVRRAVGLVHAGWRGTVQNVAVASVRAMSRHLGCSPPDIMALIGPSVGPCCYQVGAEVIRAVETGIENGRHCLHDRTHHHARFDLWEANRQQLVAAGVGRVVVAGLCTACRTDRFFSYRAEQGRTGRFGVLIGYRADGGAVSGW